MSEEEKIGKNLFEYNGIIYTDNIPKNMFISITKEQYTEYIQQKETIERQQKEIENSISKDKIREKIKELEEDIEIHSIYEENWNKINVLKELLEE